MGVMINDTMTISAPAPDTVPARTPLPAAEPAREPLLREALGGSPVREIAAALHLSPGTVRNHLSSAIGKTGTATRAEAASVARDRGWL